LNDRNRSLRDPDLRGKVEAQRKSLDRKQQQKCWLTGDPGWDKRRNVLAFQRSLTWTKDLIHKRGFANDLLVTVGTPKE